MKANIIQTIQSREKIAQERILEAQNKVHDFIKQTREKAEQIISKAAELVIDEKQEIIKIIGEKALIQINQNKKNTQTELRELNQVSPIKKDKAINLIISDILK